MERRSFIEMFVAGAVGFTGMPKTGLNSMDEVDWDEIRSQYPDSSSNLLNLNNGSAGMMPQQVESQVIKFISQMNRNPPYEKSEYWKKLYIKSKEILAEMIDASEDELALVRNTTEALQLVLNGYKIPENHNVVCAYHDYTHALNALTRLSKERNFKIRKVDVKMPADESEILEAYRKLITANTEMVLITAMTHREGQIMPVKEIAKLAKAKGAKVLVDGAHAIGQFEHSVQDWDCDFYCTSLHKWLGGPLGTGMLYIKKDLINQVKGSCSFNDKLEDKMVKFEAVGTKSFALYAAILSSLRYHQSIGTKNKHERLMELTDYWTDAIRRTPMAKTIVPNKYGGIANFHYPGPSTAILNFFKSKNIHFKKVRALNNNRTTYRISPNVYHNFKDLDRFIEDFHEFSKRI